jgi:hypothetical protein
MCRRWVALRVVGILVSVPTLDSGANEPTFDACERSTDKATLEEVGLGVPNPITCERNLHYETTVLRSDYPEGAATTPRFDDEHILIASIMYSQSSLHRLS